MQNVTDWIHFLWLAAQIHPGGLLDTLFPIHL